MTLHRKKPKMARAAWRVCGWEGLPTPKLDFMREVMAISRWHKAVKS